MQWFAAKLGHNSEFWGLVELLHDIDFEVYPPECCVKATDILRTAQYDEELVHAVCSHGYDIVVDVKPEHEMEKVLYAVDELSGLIGAAVKI
jgi:Predicted hydrolase (HD superfamily)